MKAPHAAMDVQSRVVVNAIALWNTRYMAGALEHLQAADGQVRLEDVQRLSPLRHDHINLHGRYYFTPSDAITRGELRNLCDTANPRLAAGIPPAPETGFLFQYSWEPR
jgi:hypothetical protein